MSSGVPSRSLTLAATTVAVHSVPNGRSAFGSSVRVLPLPVTVSARFIDGGQDSVNAPGSVTTGSENVTTRLAATPTPVRPDPGTVWVTTGGTSAATPKLASSMASPSSAPPLPSGSNQR